MNEGLNREEQNSKQRIMDMGVLNREDGVNDIAIVENGHLYSREEDEAISWPGKYFYNTKTKKICWTPKIDVQHPYQAEGKLIELTDEELELEKELTRQFENNEWVNKHSE